MRLITNKINYVQLLYQDQNIPSIILCGNLSKVSGCQLN